MFQHAVFAALSGLAVVAVVYAVETIIRTLKNLKLLKLKTNILHGRDNEISGQSVKNPNPVTREYGGK